MALFRKKLVFGIVSMCLGVVHQGQPTLFCRHKSLAYKDWPSLNKEMTSTCIHLKCKDVSFFHEWLAVYIIALAMKKKRNWHILSCNYDSVKTSGCYAICYFVFKTTINIVVFSLICTGFAKVSQLRLNVLTQIKVLQQQLVTTI